MDIWYFHLSNSEGRVPCGLSTFLLYTQDCLSNHSYSHTSLISSLLKNSSLLLAFCSLFLHMVEQIQTYPSSISPLGLFYGIICGTLRDLVPFAQFKKREKHPWRSVNFSKVAGWSQCVRMLPNRANHDICNIIWLPPPPRPPLFMMGFLKNYRMGDQDFPLKMGGTPNRGVVYRKKGKHCFLLVIYWFFS